MKGNQTKPKQQQPKISLLYACSCFVFSSKTNDFNLLQGTFEKKKEISTPEKYSVDSISLGVGNSSSSGNSGRIFKGSTQL